MLNRDVCVCDYTCMSEVGVNILLEGFKKLFHAPSGPLPAVHTQKMHINPHLQSTQVPLWKWKKLLSILSKDWHDSRPLLHPVTSRAFCFLTWGMCYGVRMKCTKTRRPHTHNSTRQPHQRRDSAETSFSTASRFLLLLHNDCVEKKNPRMVQRLFIINLWEPLLNNEVLE